MFMPLHRYKFESNSQHDDSRGLLRIGCLCHYIDTSLKAIHNTWRNATTTAAMFMPLHRYKFESNSQHVCELALKRLGCLCHYIDTSLKAIHNSSIWTCEYAAMFMPLHRYKFESNSQPAETLCEHVGRCLCHYIDTSLKAIHNSEGIHVAKLEDVYAIT